MHFRQSVNGTVHAKFYYQAINIAQADVHTQGRKKLLIFQFQLVISKQKGRENTTFERQKTSTDGQNSLFKISKFFEAIFRFFSCFPLTHFLRSFLD